MRSNEKRNKTKNRKMIPNGFQISSPAVISGSSGLWLTEDDTTGVGFRAPLASANTYQIITFWV